MTKYTIQYTDLAIKDIRNTVYYIKNILGNPKAATDMIDLITNSVFYYDIKDIFKLFKDIQENE